MLACIRTALASRAQAVAQGLPGRIHPHRNGQGERERHREAPGRLDAGFWR